LLKIGPVTDFAIMPLIAFLKNKPKEFLGVGNHPVTFEEGIGQKNPNLIVIWPQ